MRTKSLSCVRLSCLEKRLVAPAVHLLAHRAGRWAGLVLIFGASVTSAAEFTNTGAITIPDSGAASPYPSSITVNGFTGPVAAVRVKLNGVTHSYSDDLDIFLVAPGGLVCAVMSDAGGVSQINNRNLAFDDVAATTLPDAGTITSWTYRPANYQPSEGLPPGGMGTIGTNLTALGAGSVNGDWKLFVRDDSGNGGAGSIQSWALMIEGAGGVPAPEISVEQTPGPSLSDGNSSDISFGIIYVGTDSTMTFTIRNPGTAELTGLGMAINGVDAPMFTVTTNPAAAVAPAGSTTFTVRFTPTSAGLKSATVQIASNDADERPFDIPLNGFGVTPLAEIAIAQPLGTNVADGGSRSFGTVALGSSNSLSFSITNLGSADLIGLRITVDGPDAAMFKVTTNPTAPVTPGGSTAFIVAFTPTTPGVKNASLHITNNDTDENPFDIALTATDGTVLPEIAVEQPLNSDLADGGSRNFGNVTVGSSNSLTFAIRNIGTGDLTGLGITVDGADAAMFSVATNPTVPIAPSASTTFIVTFAPTSSGNKTATLHIANNDADENPFDIVLTGATGFPEIAVEQPLSVGVFDGGSRNFGNLTVGSSNSLTFYIRNTGTADLTGLEITLDGTNAAMFTVNPNPIAPVAPGGVTNFTLRFAPTSAGAKTVMLHLANNDVNENPFDISLTGTGFMTLPEIAVEEPANTNLVDGGSRDFGNVTVGSDSSLTFTVRNTGTAPLAGLGIAIDGTDAQLFTVTASPTAPVAPNASTTFIVRFAPTTVGIRNATLHIANNDSNENPFDIWLTGATPLPEIAVEHLSNPNLLDGGSVDFGNVNVGSSTNLTVTIRNTGTADLNGLGITVDGINAAMFAVTASPAASVAPGGNTTFTIRFTPTSFGAKTATLQITNNDADENPFDISLTGAGLTPVIEAWVQRYNGPVNRDDQAAAVAVDSSGNVIVTGSSIGVTAVNCYTAKYAAVDGARLWEKRYAGPGNYPLGALGVAVAVDASGNVAVAGEVFVVANARPDVYTAKYAAADGALLWEKIYNGPANNDDYPTAVAVDGSGNVIVTGASVGSGGSYDYYTAKYAAADGALLWEKRYNGTANLGDGANAVAVDGSGNVVVTGVSGVRTDAAGTVTDYYTAKYAAADGALLWERRYNGPKDYDDIATAVAVDGGGDVVVTGYSDGSGSDHDFYTAKYAGADGALLWEKRYDGPANYNDDAYAIAADSSGNVVVTGVSYTVGNNRDFYTAKYAGGNGALLWEKRYDGPANDLDLGHAVAVDGSNNVVVMGYSYGVASRFDFYTAKYSAVGGALLWEKRYNGPDNGDEAGVFDIPHRTLALGPNGIVAITGWTESSNFSRDYATVVYRDDSQEKLSVIAIDLVPIGVRLRFNGVPGLTYRLQRAPSVTGPWNTINTQTATASGLIEFNDTSPLPGQAFYRTVQP
jgi:uncharacterized membrane protein/subtilisin-like proprotein convertase family protein